MDVNLQDKASYRSRHPQQDVLLDERGVTEQEHVDEEKAVGRVKRTKAQNNQNGAASNCALQSTVNQILTRRRRSRRARAQGLRGA
jgi:hypothetical protein